MIAATALWFNGELAIMDARHYRIVRGLRLYLIR